MKLLKFFAILLGVTLCVVACKKDVDTTPVAATPVIKLATTEVNIEADKESVELEFTVEKRKADVLLTVTTSTEWVTPVVESDTMLKLRVKRNFTEEVRSGEVVLHYEGAEDVAIAITQEFVTGSPDTPIELIVKDYDATTITVDILTADPTLTWIPMVTYKNYWEQMSEQEIFESDLEYFNYLADNAEMSLEEFLTELVGTGSEGDIRISQLSPSTEYVVYVYGISMAGERTTAIVSQEVTTEAPWEGDITFEFDVKVNDFVMEYTVTPSHTGVNYYTNVASQQEIDAWMQRYNTTDLKEAIQKGGIDANIELYKDWGFISDRTDYFDINNVSDIMDDGWLNCNASTTYYIYAVKWNDNCDITGEVEYTTYTTPSVEPSANKLTLELQNITQSSVDVKITTTTNDPYVVLPLQKSVAEGLSDSELFELILSEYDYIISEYTYEGDITNTYGRMRPDSEYTIVGFGYKAGVLTTNKMWRETFRTQASGDAKDCTFDMNVVPSTDSAWVEIIPSDKGLSYHWMFYPASYDSAQAQNYIKNVVIKRHYGDDYAAFASWELTQGDVVDTVYDLTPDTEYKLGVVIMNPDEFEFLTDVYFTAVFRTEPVQYADITITVEFDKYFDVDELIAAGYEGYSLYEGNAMVPLKVHIEGDATAFFYDFYGNDLSDTEMFPDDIFYEPLQDGAPYEEASFFLPFDKTMTLVAVAYDEMYCPSRLYREVVTLTKDGCATVEEFEAMQQGATRGAVPASVVFKSEVKDIKISNRVAR